MRFLFTSVQLEAHLDWGGYLATAAELTRRGHQVLWASGNAVQRAVAAAGVRFEPLSETGWRWPPPPPRRPLAGESADEYARARAGRALDQWLDVKRVESAVDALQPVVDRFHPHLIVSEMFVAAAGLCAERAGIPLAIVGWPAHAPARAPFSGLELSTARLQRLLEHYALSGQNFASEGPPALLSPHLHITFWSERWFHGAHILPQTQHVGGRAATPLPPDPTLPPPDQRPWLWITLGTTFGDDPSFFRMATQAAHELGCLPIVSTGSASPNLAWLSHAASETVIVERINFPAVLPYIAAAIHHGGAGVTHALVTHAVPQVVVPHAGDQERQATGVRRSGVGVSLTAREVTSTRLADVLATLLPDSSPHRSAATSLRDEFAALGGVARAARLLEEVQGATREGTGPEDSQRGA